MLNCFCLFNESDKHHIKLMQRFNGASDLTDKRELLEITLLSFLESIQLLVLALSV